MALISTRRMLNIGMLYVRDIYFTFSRISGFYSSALPSQASMRMTSKLTL